MLGTPSQHCQEYNVESIEAVFPNTVYPAKLAKLSCSPAHPMKISPQSSVSRLSNVLPVRRLPSSPKAPAEQTCFDCRHTCDTPEQHLATQVVQSTLGATMLCPAACSTAHKLPTGHRLASRTRSQTGLSAPHHAGN